MQLVGVVRRMRETAIVIGSYDRVGRHSEIGGGIVSCRLSSADLSSEIWVPQTLVERRKEGFERGAALKTGKLWAGLKNERKWRR